MEKLLRLEMGLLPIRKVINKELGCPVYWQILVRNTGPGGVSYRKVENILETYIVNLGMSKENG